MPEYDYPEMTYGDEKDYYSFFYFWHTKFIVRINYSGIGSDSFKIYVVKENDEIFVDLKIQLNDIKVFPVLVSSNG